MAGTLAVATRARLSCTDLPAARLNAAGRTPCPADWARRGTLHRTRNGHLVHVAVKPQPLHTVSMHWWCALGLPEY